jgi:uncharacterized membrane protein YbhN (UPF0104 family)
MYRENQSTDPVPKSKFSSWKIALRLLGTVLAIAMLLTIVDLKSICDSIAHSNRRFLLAAAFLSLLSVAVISLRLKLFLSVVKYPVSFRNCLTTTMCGLSLNLILPARGGDLLKLAYLPKRHESSWGTLAGAALLERFVDILALGLIGLIASLFLGLQNVTIIASLVVFVTILCLFLLPRLGSFPVIGKKIGNFPKIIQEASKKKRVLLACFFTSCLCWTTNSIIMGILVKAFDDSVATAHVFAATPPSILAGIVPVSLWGVGTRDGALAYYLQGVTAAENALSAGFFYTVLVYWLLGLIGLPSLLFAKRKRLDTTDNASEQNAPGSS